MSRCAPILIELSESEFQLQVMQLAHSHGWDTMHIGRVGKYVSNGAKGSMGIGWPDLVLVRNHRLLFVELKAQKAPPPSTAQRKVLELLGQVPCAEVYVWRPSDLPLVLEVLT